MPDAHNTQPAHSPWAQGWYRFARHVRSPNFGARPPQASIDLVVLHSISLPPGIYGGREVEQLFTNTLDWDAHPFFKSIEGLQVSSHFYVQRGGELWQFVSCDDRAWHAGVSSYRGRSNCNDDSIGIELEGLEGELFTDAQYETLQSLLPALLTGYPIAHIAGHEHIAPGRKGDPGAGMDWARLQQSTGLFSQYFPDGILSQIFLARPDSNAPNWIDPVAPNRSNLHALYPCGLAAQTPRKPAPVLKFFRHQARCKGLPQIRRCRYGNLHHATPLHTFPSIPPCAHFWQQYTMGSGLLTPCTPDIVSFDFGAIPSGDGFAPTVNSSQAHKKY